MDARRVSMHLATFLVVGCNALIGLDPGHHGDGATDDTTGESKGPAASSSAESSSADSSSSDSSSAAAGGAAQASSVASSSGSGGSGGAPVGIACPNNACMAGEVCCDDQGLMTVFCDLPGCSQDGNAIVIPCANATDCSAGEYCCGTKDPNSGAFTGVACDPICTGTHQHRLCDPGDATSCAMGACQISTQLGGFYVCN